MILRKRFINYNNINVQQSVMNNDHCIIVGPRLNATIIPYRYATWSGPAARYSGQLL